MHSFQHFLQYIYLMRLHKPIGIMLLLWPTLWALWLASGGAPDKQLLVIFVLGVIVMRSLGCVINDFADRHVDKFVQRTRERPLASGKLKPIEAMGLAVVLSVIAFGLVLFCNAFTIILAIVGLLLAGMYPLLKRYTHLPQLGLGVAFSWGVPMAFAAQTGQVPQSAWLLFLTSAIWPVAYDTIYAMMDKEDDVKVGIKSTAILFNSMDKVIIALLQSLFILLLVMVGLIFHLKAIYYVSLLGVFLLFIYQQWLIKQRHTSHCYRAFANNNWVGFIIFMGIFANYLWI